MSEMTYIRCPLCKGTRWMPSGDCSTVLCLCASGQHAGWAETGLTLGQQERAVRQAMLAQELFNTLRPMVPAGATPKLLDLLERCKEAGLR